MIETDRLRLIPLTHLQLLKYVLADNSLELELQLNPTLRTVSPELKEALEETIIPNVADEKRNYLFSTLWTAILKTENKMVGDLCFIGEPNQAGEVEIGYGTYEAFRKRGLMTEALGGMIAWAKTQSSVKAIIASTDEANTDSFAVLQKNGFVKSGATGNLLHWRLQWTD